MINNRPPLNIIWEEYLNGHYKRTDRLGETIEFVRYGNIPKNEKSRWWHTLGEGLDSYPELDGLSVIEIRNGKEIMTNKYRDGFFDRIKYIGKGIIVRWGPDGEPLVKVLHVKRE